MRLHKTKKTNKKLNYELLPLLFIVLIFPFIIHLKEIQTGLDQLPWIPMEMSKRADFFLYWKSRLFVAVGVVMLLLIADGFLIRGRKEASKKKWIPLLLYELLAVISTCASPYREYSLYGMMEHFETIWVLLGYGILAYYAYSVVREERDFQIVGIFLVAVWCVQLVIGLFQMAGFDLLKTDFIRQLLLIGTNGVSGSRMVFNFSGEAYRRVYGTFYNPNYAGVYYVMMLPVAYAYLKNAGKKGKICLPFLAAADIVCMIGTGSKSAAAALAVVIVFGMVYEILHNHYKVWQGCLILSASLLIFLVYDKAGGTETMKRFMDGFALSEADDKLQGIRLKGDCVQVQFQDRKISFYYKENGKALYPVFIDENGNEMKYISEEKSQTCTLADKELKDLTFQCYRKNEIPYIVMEYNKIKWRFTNRTESGNYQYITIWGKPDNIEQAKSLFFTGKETLFTNRGYIWGRTLPLLKKYLFWGSGPDSFLLVFPQDDYVMRANLGYGFFSEILTKPHSLYLQIALQTGVLSLICFLILLFGYFLDSIRLYYQRKSLQKAEQEKSSMDLGAGIFLALLAYAVTGITNDSMLVTAPYFWLLLGMGMRRNIFIK